MVVVVPEKHKMEAAGVIKELKPNLIKKKKKKKGRRVREEE